MLTQAESRLLHALKSRAGREKNDAFAVEGVRVVEELLPAGIDLRLAVVSPSLEDSGRGRALLEALDANTVVRRVSEGELRALADTDTPQGVIAVAKIPRRDVGSIEIGDSALVLVIDAVQDPGNLGTLIRSADAFAVDCVIALTGTVDYWNPKVVRAAAGAAFRVPLVAAEPDVAWTWLQRHHFAMLGADTNGEPVHEIARAARIALVVGNEGAGLRKETRAMVEHVVAIPMPGRAESLNVAVAAGILLYELRHTNR